MTQTILKIDWCSHDAAKYAVEHWHYSRSMPAGKTVKVGVWEDDKFIGVVIFSRGANCDLGKPYGCSQIESCELTRIALKSHKTPVTRIASIALKFLKKHDPGIRLIISFADPEQGHHGGIYQGGGWVYVGKTIAANEYLVNGKRMHGRSMRAAHGTHIGKPFIERIKGSSKFRYLMALDDDMRQKIERLRKPYPKRAKQAIAGVQPDSGGAAPTGALHKDRKNITRTKGQRKDKL